MPGFLINHCYFPCSSLREAYQKCGTESEREALLSGLRAGRTKRWDAYQGERMRSDEGNGDLRPHRNINYTLYSSRKLGPILSHLIYSLYWKGTWLSSHCFVTSVCPYTLIASSPCKQLFHSQNTSITSLASYASPVCQTFIPPPNFGITHTNFWSMESVKLKMGLRPGNETTVLLIIVPHATPSWSVTDDNCS